MKLREALDDATAAAPVPPGLAATYRVRQLAVTLYRPTRVGTMPS